MLLVSRKGFNFIATGILIILITTIVFSFLRDRQYSHTRYVTQIKKRIDHVVAQVNWEQERAASALQSSTPPGSKSSYPLLHDPYYIYRDGTLIFWSDHSAVPDFYMVSDDFHYAFKEISGSQYLAVKKSLVLDSIRYDIVTMVTLFKKYEITNQYLQSGFNAEIIPNPQISLYPSPDKPDKIYAIDGTFLFSMEFYPGYKPEAGFPEYFFFILLLTGIGLVITGIVFQTGYLRTREKYGAALLFLLLSLFVIRVIMITAGFPYNLVEIPLFSYLPYASSFLNASLGDLFLNLLLLLAVIGFLYTVYTKKNFYRRFYKTGTKTAFAFSVLMALNNIILVLFIYRLVSSMVRHSQWSLDVTANLSYSFSKIFSYFLYFVGSLIFLLGSYVNNSIFFRLQRYRKLYILSIQVAAGMLFILFSFLLDFQGYLQAMLSLIFILLISILDIRGIFNRLNYRTFLFILISIIVCSASISLSITRQVNIKNHIDRDRFAFQLLQNRDVLTEYFIAEAANNITQDVFIQNRLFSPFASKDIVEDKIRKTYLNNYLDKFDINILLFNSQGLPINTAEGLNYDDIKQRYALDRYQTDYNGLYFYQQEKPALTRRYLSFIPINRYDHPVGYVILDLKLKKIIRNKVYPRLLLDEHFLSNYYEDLYNYAIYNNSALSYTSGDFNYQKYFQADWLNNPSLYYLGIMRNGYWHKGYHGSNNKILVISWEDFPVSYGLANFSFSFLIQLLGLVLFMVIYTAFSRFRHIRMNYLTRIQLYINLAFFIPLVIISILLISRISRDYTQEEQEVFLKKAETTSGNLISYIEQYRQNRIGREELYNQVSDVANLTESDINIFGVEMQKGHLIATSQPDVFEKKLLSGFVNPEAYREIVFSGELGLIVNERIGRLDYQSAYVAVKSTQTGELLGILSIPFFTSQASIERRIIDLMVSVINTFTIIFISFLFLSYIISTNLVFPIKQMISRIRFTSLTGNNQPIDYQSQDEIGQLVEAYNSMIIKLEQSRRAIAASEKEAGWREMAKQVAHEIKNPLTPMKLTLQHMKMRMESSVEDEKNSIGKAIDSMLLNIDTLNNIADSFSNYAKMPVPTITRFDVTGLLKQVAGLYMSNDEARTSFDLPEVPVFMKGDEYWLGRAFSNLIINSIQAAQTGKTAKVEVMMKKLGDRLMVTVADNGKGIPESIRDRIFMPNFSTKFTGSGIGLAVARRAVEHAGGKIWFESTENKGTTFYIELPVEV